MAAHGFYSFGSEEEEEEEEEEDSAAASASAERAHFFSYTILEPEYELQDPEEISFWDWVFQQKIHMLVRARKIYEQEASHYSALRILIFTPQYQGTLNSGPNDPDARKRIYTELKRQRTFLMEIVYPSANIPYTEMEPIETLFYRKTELQFIDYIMRIIFRDLWGS